MFTFALILFTAWILFGLFIFGVLGFNFLLIIGWLIGLGFLRWFLLKIKDIEKKEIKRLIIGFIMVFCVAVYAIYNGYLVF